MQSQGVGTFHHEPKYFRHLWQFSCDQNGLTVKELDGIISHHKLAYKLSGSKDMRYRA